MRRNRCLYDSTARLAGTVLEFAIGCVGPIIAIGEPIHAVGSMRVPIVSLTGPPRCQNAGAWLWTSAWFQEAHRRRQAPLWTAPLRESGFRSYRGEAGEYFAAVPGRKRAGVVYPLGGLD